MKKTIILLISLVLGNCLYAQKSISKSLDGEWNLYYGVFDKNAPANPDELVRKNWPMIKAVVPGNVELDLLAAGIIKNPETGNNIYELRKYEAYQWWYYKKFEKPQLTEGERVEIVFEGLDCFGTIWVNNKPVGKTDNMLIDHRFDITDLLNPGTENSIYVRIDPAVAEAQKYINGTIGSKKFFRVEQEHVRKAPHMYGWDIMPRLISAGLWRSVYLKIKQPTRFEQVYWMTDEVDVPKKSAKLLLDWQFSTDYLTIDGLTMEVSLKQGTKTIFEDSYPLNDHSSRQRITLNNIDFWWPRGYGNPTLYQAVLRIVDDKKNVLDENVQKIGIRTADLIYTESTSKEKPGEFVFKINGEKIFVKGTNWVPLDAFHSRDKRHLKDAFQMITDLNCNMIRCWGGNVYEDNDFFELCDQNGVMVWQDFALAGTQYPQDYQFAEKIREEAVNVILKLRHHPSLVLWSGNNEIDQSLTWNFKKPVDPRLDIISREVLPRAVWEFDPLRTYLPSSPYCSEEYFRQGNNSDVLPEVHLWGPRGYYKTPFYTNVNAHFVSEIGYHGCPNRSSLEKMFDPKYVYPWINDWTWNDEWETKSVRSLQNSTLTFGRNDLMINQVKALFGECPKDLDKFIFASQTVQAEAMKFFIELWRMDKFRKTGILWWNLRDGWPIISDAVVDYYNSRKLAYYYIKQVQYNTCVMIGDPENGNHPVVAVNDTREEQSGTVSVKDADNGETLFTSSFIIPANGITTVGYIPERDKRSMWLIDYSIGKVKYLNHYLNGKAPFSLDDYQRWYKKLNITRE
ncbi:MAG TPA: glycoside hydrolase family 2 TIM barrel-domain containing protein [Bacteroidales bacterium]|mgnify:CR=1 FL=1|nr:glycoside hydrolase family 2 TIM barrel-domain containing protein [Bacteroidales bacterium]